MKNILIVISGPSGVGKGEIVKQIVERNKDVVLSISCTTREKRMGEIDGKHYFFISHSEFEKRIKDEKMLEYSQHFGNYYGTPKDFVLSKLANSDVLLEIDVNGGLNVKKAYPQAVLIMILPPSKEELKNRLLKRHTETDEQIAKRMERMEYELSKKEMYDYVVINDNLTSAVKNVENIIYIEKNR